MTEPLVLPPGQEPDLDQVLDAVVAFVAAATYADAVRRVDEITIHCYYQDRPADAGQFRDAAVRAEGDVRDALFGLLDHERVLRLIPLFGRARRQPAYRAEGDYQQLARSEYAAGDHSDATADGDGGLERLDGVQAEPVDEDGTS